MTRTSTSCPTSPAVRRGPSRRSKGCASLAAALIGADELVRPEAIVIGGFAASVPGHTDEVTRQLSLLAWPGQSLAPVLPARLGDRASPHGAMLAARDALAR